MTDFFDGEPYEEDAPERRDPRLWILVALTALAALFGLAGWVFDEGALLVLGLASAIFAVALAVTLYDFRR